MKRPARSPTRKEAARNMYYEMLETLQAGTYRLILIDIHEVPELWDHYHITSETRAFADFRNHLIFVDLPRANFLQLAIAGLLYVKRRDFGTEAATNLADEVIRFMTAAEIVRLTTSLTQSALLKVPVEICSDAPAAKCQSQSKPQRGRRPAKGTSARKRPKRTANRKVA